MAAYVRSRTRFSAEQREPGMKDDACLRTVCTTVTISRRFA